MTKLLLLGGFLGSGKTTFMIAGAKYLEKKGYKAAVITNDQGDTLVDTFYSRSEGIAAREVSGGCFCCRFPDFLNTVREISLQENPDYIIAEAVGSCTDLSATVVNPLKTFHSDVVEVAGFVTLVDARRMLDDFSRMNLSHPVEPSEVLISHQLRESSVLVLSKTDLLNRDELEKVEDMLKVLNPRADFFACSSRTGEGMDTLLDNIIRGLSLDFSFRVDLDYDVYARAEAEYGWYNGSWFISRDEAVSPSELSFILMESFDNPRLGYVAHAKVFILSPDGVLKVSNVGGRVQADHITLSDRDVQNVQVVLNIRSACSPEVIGEHVQSLHESLSEQGYQIRDYEWDALVPSPPEPYYS